MLNNPDQNSAFGAELATYLATIRDKLKHGGKLSKGETSKLWRLKKRYENLILDKSQVICVTCVASVDERLINRKFKYLIVDEVAQSTGE